MPIQPTTPKELCEALRSASLDAKTITLGGQFSKRQMAGPIAPSDVTISTSAMNRILQYEPRDLTLSVEAGASFAEVSRTLAANNQMIPLDPPYGDTATIGGVIASNAAGPRRRLYGSARDLVIGMQFATLEGKIVQSGGMVVKNVAGLDMGKLMIGSFGTLAAMAVVNFKLLPRPALERTCLLAFDTLEAALAIRDRLIRSVLQPSAVDLLNPLAAVQLGQRGFLLAVQFGGNAAVVDRYEREIGEMANSVRIEGAEETKFWRAIQNYAPRFVEKFTEGAVVRISSAITQVADVFGSLEVPVISRAASGVSYACFNRTDSAVKWLAGAKKHPWKCVIEYSPENMKTLLDLWPAPGPDFAIMKKIKQMFDPRNLLNNGRLYRLI